MIRQTAFAAALIYFAALKANAVDEPFHPREFAASYSDIREMLELDIYKFVTRVQMGDRFKIVLREWSKQDAKPVVLFQESFSVVTMPRDGDMTLVLGFMKPDNTIGSALRSNLPTMNLKLSASNCKPHSVTKSFAVPLADLASKEIRRGAGEVLLKVTKPKEDGETTAYPYAELIIERDK